MTLSLLLTMDNNIHCNHLHPQHYKQSSWSPGSREMSQRMHSFYILDVSEESYNDIVYNFQLLMFISSLVFSPLHVYSASGIDDAEIVAIAEGLKACTKLRHVK